MLSSSVKSGRVPDTEQTNGMVTSLWFSFECLGGYLGSAGGGIAYDEIGFRNSTLIIIGIQVDLLITEMANKGGLKSWKFCERNKWMPPSPFSRIFQYPVCKTKTNMLFSLF